MANQNTPSVPEQEQDSNTLRQIRLEKLRQGRQTATTRLPLPSMMSPQRQHLSRQTMKSPRQSSRKKPAMTKKLYRQSWTP